MKTTLTTNTSTSWVTDHNGSAFMQAVGTWGGGTLTIEIQLIDGSTVQALEGGAFTSGPVSKIVKAPRGTPVRFTLSGSSGASIVTQITCGPI